MPIYLSNNSILTEFDYKTIQEDSILKVNFIRVLHFKHPIFYRILKNSAAEFLSNKLEFQGPVKCLFVDQREYATVKFDDPYICIIGSDNATTCHIVLIVDESKNF